MPAFTVIIVLRPLTCCGSSCVRPFALPSRDSCFPACVRTLVPVAPARVSKPLRILHGAAHFLSLANEWATAWLPHAIASLPRRPSHFSVARGPLLHVSPLKVRSRWLVLSIGLRAYLHGYDPSLPAQIHRPGSMETSLRVYLLPLFPKSFVPAWSFSLLCDFGLWTCRQLNFHLVL